MALHICRDFLSTGNPLTYYTPYMGLYYLAIFMRVTLDYAFVGQTNFNIEGSLRLGHGTNGSLNQGTGNEYAFVPDGYTATAADIGRILAIKSPGFPMVNSGLFRVTGVDTTSNYVFINYRSGDLPPVETGMKWGLYDNETAWQTMLNSAGNGTTGTYQGQGAATQSRLILQSPSVINWQCRLTVENSYDAYAGGGAATALASIAPGYGGTNAGDFLPGGPHLHAALFFNKHTQDYAGLVVGFSPSGNQARIYIWGDDVSGTVWVAGRGVVGGTDSFACFGLAEDEELPLPPKSAQRLFSMGSNDESNGIYWTVGTKNSVNRGGCSFGLSNQPISCIFSLYNPLFGNVFGGAGNNQPIRSTGTASDCPYLGATELVPVDMLAGTHDNMNVINSSEVLILEGRRLGRAPFVRLGRSNYGNWQISTDAAHSWFHTEDGMYLPWQGSILP